MTFDHEAGCPNCDEYGIGTETIDHTFQYGANPGVPLTVQIPLRKCLTCGFEFLDWEASEIQDRAVAEYLASHSE